MDLSFDLNWSVREAQWPSAHMLENKDVCVELKFVSLLLEEHFSHTLIRFGTTSALSLPLYKPFSPDSSVSFEVISGFSLLKVKSFRAKLNSWQEIFPLPAAEALWLLELHYCRNMIEILKKSFKWKFMIYSSSRPLAMIEDCYTVPCSVQTTCTGRCCRWWSSTPTWELHPGAWSPSGAGPVCWRPTCAACMTCCPCWTGNGISSSTSVPQTSPPGQHRLRWGSE